MPIFREVPTPPSRKIGLRGAYNSVLTKIQFFLQKRNSAQYPTAKKSRRWVVLAVRPIDGSFVSGSSCRIKPIFQYWNLGG